MKATKIISWALALLGFSACGDDDNGGGMVMYGVPSAQFRLDGSVTDEAGKPVRDIKIAVQDPENDGLGEAVGLTDAYGRYSIATEMFPSQHLEVTAIDIDGSNNGEFETGSQTLEIKPEDYVGGDGWFIGTVYKTADFVLEPKGDEGN